MVRTHGYLVCVVLTVHARIRAERHAIKCLHYASLSSMLEYVHEWQRGEWGGWGSRGGGRDGKIKSRGLVSFHFRELAANSLQFYAAFVAVSFAMKEDRPSCERVPRSYA